VLLARYLCEHIAHIWPDWLDRYLSVPWPQFWEALARVPVDITARGSPAFEDC
jgi:hypothetical protein